MSSAAEALFGPPEPEDPETKTLACPHCDETFTTSKSARGASSASAMRTRHIKAEHPGAAEDVPGTTDGPAASSAPRRNPIRAFFTRKGAVDGQTNVVPRRPKAKVRRVGRTSLAPAGSLLWTLGATVAGRAGDVPVAKVLGVQTPVAGQALDRALAGTMLDRIIQPLAADADRYSELASLVSFPMVVAIYERNPSPPLEAVLDMLIRRNLLAMADAIKVAKREAEHMAEATAELASVGMEFGSDPVSEMKAWLFGAPIAPQPEPAPVS